MRRSTTIRRRRPPALGAALLGLALSTVLGACSAGGVPGGDGGNGGGDGGPGARDLATLADLVASADGGGLILDRPYQYKVPKGYDPATAWPLVVLLHGYSASGAEQDAYFRLGTLVDTRGFLFAFPDGTRDRLGNRFWNASDACCDLFQSGVDDVAYLTAVIDDMSARFHVDAKRIHLVGHSNGGFMSHRLACDRSTRIASIAVLAGDAWKDPAKCATASPVSVLQLHGDADLVIAYGGGQVLGGAGAYPSARASVEGWAGRNGCKALTTMGAPLDLTSDVPGSETQPEAWEGCPPGGAAELWTLHFGSHIPTLQASWPTVLYDWLAAHPKP